MEATETTIITEAPNIPFENSISNDFYIVGLFKLAVLFSCTFGLYLVYWFFKQWQQQKTFSGVDCWPAVRSIFLIFFTHTLFGKIDKKLRLNGKEYDWSSQYTATLFVMLVLASRILDKLYLKGIGLPYTDIAGWIVFPIIGLLMLYVQRIINFACNDPEGKSNAKLTGFNFFWIIMGTILFVFYIIGLFVEVE